MSAFTVLESELDKMRSIHDELQASIVDIHGEIKSLENRPIDTGAAIQNLKDYLSSQKTEDVLNDMVKAFSHDRPITNWNNRLTARCFDNAEASGAVSSRFIQANFGPLLSVLFEKTRLDQMSPMIEKYCKRHGGVTTETRDKQITELREQVRKLEEQEEASISEAEINDVWSFTRRPDADPAVVLNFTE